MSRPTRRGVAALALLALAGLGACAPEDQATPATSASASGSASTDACAKDQLELKSPGTLTVGTDKPAFPPYFEDDDPTNGKGFESAVAYAVADQLGFAKSDVKWTVVPVNSS